MAQLIFSIMTYSLQCGHIITGSSVSDIITILYIIIINLILFIFFRMFFMSSFFCFTVFSGGFATSSASG